MLDTVNLGVGVSVPGGVRELRDRGWSVGTLDKGERFDAWATTQADGVRLKWGAGFDWLSAEASVPALVRGSNEHVLEDWSECVEGMLRMVDVAERAVGWTLPTLEAWRLSRVDPVWAWSQDPAPYLSAVRTAKLPRLEPVLYPDGVSWQTPKGKRKRVRMYDKARECGHSVERPLRLELQVRSKAVHRLDGVRVGHHLASWGPETCLGLVRQTVEGLGLSEPVHGADGALEALLAHYGPSKARALYGALLEARAAGGWSWSGVSDWTAARIRRDLSAAGVSTLSEGGSLEPLSVPEAHDLSLTCHKRCSLQLPNHAPEGVPTMPRVLENGVVQRSDSVKEPSRTVSEGSARERVLELSSGELVPDSAAAEDLESLEPYRKGVRRVSTRQNAGVHGGAGAPPSRVWVRL